jgi:type IV secretory pathway TrbD component
MNMAITLLFMTMRNTRRRIVFRVGPVRIVQVDLNSGRSCRPVVSLFDGMFCCIVIFELMGWVIAGSGVLIPI